MLLLWIILGLLISSVAFSNKPRKLTPAEQLVADEAFKAKVARAEANPYYYGDDSDDDTNYDTNYDTDDNNDNF